MDTKEAIKKSYEKLSEKSKTDFFAKAKDGRADFPDALKYSTSAGTAMYDSIISNLPAGLTPDEIMDILPEGLEDLYEDALEAAEAVQRIHNENAGIGLNPVEIEPDADRIKGVATHISEKGELSEEDRLNIENLANSAVDKTIRENCRFQSNSGLRVTVSRRYDGVGLKGGRCSWCIQREGEKVSYEEAMDMGMFQRHPGCGCEITYYTEKATYRQSADWTWNGI